MRVGIPGVRRPRRHVSAASSPPPHPPEITRIRSSRRRSSPTFEGHLRVARNVARSSSSCELRLPANAGMPPPPPATRAVIWSRVSRAATCERSGPLRPPLPSIWWQAQQLLVTKSSEPCVAGASSPAVTVDERPAPWSRGTHGDSSPAVVSAAYAMNGSATAAIATACAVHALPRDRRLRDAALHDEVQVYAEKPEDRRRDQENVRRVEARERRAADVRSCNDQRHKPTADHGRLRCLFGCDDDGPERVLIPPQELPGECHRERAEEEQRS